MTANVRLKVPLIPECAVRIFAQRTWISAFIIFFTSFLPYFSASTVVHFSANTVVPALRTFFLILAPQVWQGATQWLTQPVLFLLLNCVVLSIWVSTACQTDPNSVSFRKENIKEAQSIRSIAAQLPDEMTMQSSPSLHSLEVPPVKNERQLSLISHSHNEKADTLSCCNSQADHQEEFRSKAGLQKMDGLILKKNENIKRVKRQTSNLEKRNKGFKSKAISRVHSETRASAFAASEAQSAEEAALKIFDKSCSMAFPHNSSGVIVRDMSMSEGMAEAMVIDKDDLNKRIDAFFTRFRRQLQLQRQESLRRRTQR